jgi:predicted DNA-binding transcriptional regulator YafY
MDPRTERRRTQVFIRAAANDLPVGFTYMKDGVRERRQIVPDPVDPIRRGANGAYVIGHDLARDDARSFRLSRMVRVNSV